jgi:integrating conjugative element relaxase (TIGR03760 family)
MLKALRRKLRQTPSSTATTRAAPAPQLASLNLQQLPLLSSSTLVQILDAANLLRSVRRLVAVQDAHWAALYQPALDRFLEACQLAPASMAHHHAGPGGLAAHTLETLEIALRHRKPLVLPRNADPDTSARQEHIWTYALFVAVLMHDIGKLHTTIRLRLSSNQYWNPYLRLDQHQGEHYQVEFTSAPYKLHQRIANSGLHLLPNAGMAWLDQYPHILSHVCAYLYGDIFEAGIIGELAQKADGESVAQNLKRDGDRVRFPGAPTIPLVDRLMIGLRQMLEAKELKINGHGADGWSDGQYLWLVCGTVAKKLIEYLRQEGSTQIPTDHNRIFDTLQEHGYILPTASGKAIWHTVVTGPEGAFRFELTMLKFEIARLLPPTRRPAALNGTIEVIERTDNGATGRPPLTTEAAPASPISPATAPTATRTSVPEQPTTTAEPAPDSQDSLPNWMQDDTTDSVSTPSAIHTAPAQDTDYTVHPVDGMDTDMGEAAPASLNPAAETMNFDDIRPRHLDDNTGQYFMDWLSRMLRNGKLPVNRQDAVIHIVPEGALVVSPRAFKEFIAFFDLYLRENGNKLTNDEAARHVQKKVEKLRQNIKNPTGMSVHTYTISGQNKVSRVSGFLFEPLKLFGYVSPPPANPHLSSQQANHRK